MGNQAPYQLSKDCSCNKKNIWVSLKNNSQQWEGVERCKYTSNEDSFCNFGIYCVSTLNSVYFPSLMLLIYWNSFDKDANH